MKTLTDNTEWAIEEALANGVEPEQIAHNINPIMNRTEKVRLIRQLLIDMTEDSADLHENEELVMQQLNRTLTNLAVDVQTATRKYL